MRILAAARDPEVLRQLVKDLPAEWAECEVIPAPTEEAVYDRFLRYDPEVVLLSSHLEASHLGELLGWIREETDAPILILAQEHDELARARAFASGADDWLDPPLQPRIVVAHVRAVLRRLEPPPTPAALPDFVLGDLVINCQTQHVRWAGQTLKLTAREFALLCVLVQHVGQAVPTHELESRMVSVGRTPGRSSVKTVVSRLRAKLGKDHVIETVPRVGYRWAYLGHRKGA